VSQAEKRLQRLGSRRRLTVGIGDEPKRGRLREKLRFVVSGHDFSRAAKDGRRIGLLAPEVRLSFPHREFFRKLLDHTPSTHADGGEGGAGVASEIAQGDIRLYRFASPEKTSRGIDLE
jgi:hypothetical protein